MNDANPRLVFWKRVLVELELGGRGQGVVATDRDQRTDAEGLQRVADILHLLGLFRIRQILRLLERLAGIGSGPYQS